MHRDDGEQDIVVGDNNQDSKNVLEKITKKKKEKNQKRFVRSIFNNAKAKQFL
jgi:hypothetical protein